MGLVDMDAGHVFGMKYRNFHTLGPHGCLKHKKIGILDHRGCLKIRKSGGLLERVPFSYPMDSVYYQYYRSEEFPERDISSLGTLGDGGWPGWGVLPPAPSRPWPGLARPGHFEK